MRNAYFINDEKVLVGKTVLNDDEVVTENLILQPPPLHDYDNEVPVWDDNDWKIVYTEKGKIRAFDEARKKRNQLLQSTDWTQLPDITLPTEKKTAVLEYRQKLRDMFNGITDPKELVWPELTV
jgi:hypothetical protein